MGFRTLSDEVCETRAGNPIYMETDVKRVINRIKRNLTKEGIGFAVTIINLEMGDRFNTDNSKEAKK